MRPFVEECLREWKRLGVADPVANEMAADLEADIAEAEADGGSAEDVLGIEAFDAPTFARSWAESRGLVAEPAPPAAQPSRFRRWYPVAGIAVCLLVALFGVMLLVAQPQKHVTVAAQAGFVFPRIEKFRGAGVPPRLRFVKPGLVRPGEKFLPGRAVFVAPDNPGPNLDLAGALFLVFGLGGAAGFAFVLYRRGRGTPATA